MHAGQSSYQKSGNAALSILPVCASRLLIACQLAYRFLLLDSAKPPPVHRPVHRSVGPAPGRVAGPARPIQPAPAGPAGPSWASDQSTLNTHKISAPLV